MDKRILIFFGKTGAGKNFVAKLFAREFDYDWYDADIDLTPEMIYAIKHHLEFTVEMRGQYFEVVERRVKDLLRVAEKIVITQGLFKNINRHDLMKIFPLAKWIWVDAATSIIEARVCKRNNLVTPEYARQINEYFETPDFICYKILNNQSEAEILAQALWIEREWRERR